MLFLFALALTFYYFLHSFLAARAVKNWIVQKAGFPIRFYRLSYNIVFLGLSALLVWLYLRTDGKALFSFSSIWLWVGWGFVLLGSIIGGIALNNYNLAEFAGTYQYSNKTEYKSDFLRTDGLNSIVRHPLYLGIFLAIWGLFFVAPTDSILVFSFITSVYIFIGIKLEEKKLIELFGESYKAYQKRVPMLFPFFK